MARIRTIKPSIWGDAKFAGLSRDARLMVIGLISHADDAGRFIASASAIAGAVYPHDDLPPAQVRRWRDEVAETGLIALYRVDGREYGSFPKWTQHQRIDRPQPSTLPPPFVEPFVEPFDEQPSNVSPPNPRPVRGGKGREGKGDEANASSSAKRADVERICEHLADRIAANGSKRPQVTQRWRDAARLLLDRDGRTEAQVTAAIDWCQADPFWSANILSMPKLRDKYDQLRLQAQRTSTPPPTPPTVTHVDTWAATKERDRAQSQREQRDDEAFASQFGDVFKAVEDA